MKKLFLMVAALAAVCALSCKKEDQSSRKEIAQGESMLEGPQEQVVPAVIPEFYVSGVEFAGGYDWRLDPDYGYSDCSIFLENKKGRLLDFGAGYEAQVPSESDMVRTCGAHVYTDFSTESETVIKRDGVELFRYPGREMILGLVENEDGVYTLGVSRSTGEGWTYRLNGAIKVSSKEGDVLRPLYVDGNEIIFTYKIGAAGGENTYFIVRNGLPQTVTTGSDYKIIDYMVCAGKMYKLLSSSMFSHPILDQDGRMWSVYVHSSMAGIDSCFLETDGTDIFVGGYITMKTGLRYAAVWKNIRMHTEFEPGLELDYLYPSGDEVMAVLHRVGGSGAPILYSGKEYLELDEGYRVSSKSCGAFVNGYYCLCLNPEMPGSKPYYIMNGNHIELEINGWLAGVSYIFPETPQPSDEETEE